MRKSVRLICDVTTLTPEEAEYVARKRFYLQEINPDSFLLVKESNQDYLQHTLEVLHDRASSHQSLYLIRQNLLNYLSPSELNELQLLHASIMDWYFSASAKENGRRYRELISKIKIDQPPSNILESHFARKLLEQIYKYASQAVEAFSGINNGIRTQDLIASLHATNNDISGVIGDYDQSVFSLQTLDQFNLNESQKRSAYVLSLLSAIKENKNDYD